MSGNQNIIDKFATAYFNGNVDTIQKFLASTYVGEIEKYESTGSISDLTVKGLSDADEKKLKMEDILFHWNSRTVTMKICFCI